MAVNGLTLSVVCCCVIMAFVVEIKAQVDCSKAGEFMFMCYSGNKRRVAEPVPETRSAVAGSSVRRHTEAEMSGTDRRGEPSPRRLSSEEELLRSRILDIAARLLEVGDDRRAVEETEDKRDYVFPEERDAMKPEMDDKRSLEELDEDRRVMNVEKSSENTRKRLLTRWLNEGQTNE